MTTSSSYDPADLALVHLHEFVGAPGEPCQTCGRDVRANYHPRAHKRPSWDAWGLELAKAVALRADCSRRQVGAVVITPDRSVVATGYNGAPSGETGCLSGGCPRAQSTVAPGTSYDTGAGACVAIHAEQNALLRASWAEMKGSTLYITDEPCGGCWRMIRATPLWRVYWPDGETLVHPDARST